MEPILQVQDLNYIYSVGTPFQHQALENVSFSVERGEFIGIIGHTGSGKSTLMQQLNGLLKPTSGKILLDGQDIWSDKKLTRQARFRVGLVFQNAVYLGVKKGSGSAVGNGFHHTLVQIESRFQEGFAVAGGAGADNLCGLRQHLFQFPNGKLGCHNGVALVIGIEFPEQFSVFTD